MTGISRIYSMAHGPAPTGAEANERNQAARTQAWQVHGMAVLDPSDITDDWLRRAVINQANALYGVRKGVHDG